MGSQRVRHDRATNFFILEVFRVYFSIHFSMNSFLLNFTKAVVCDSLEMFFKNGSFVTDSLRGMV